MEAAVSLAEEIGPELVTMREAARRAGVSSGAPFRHFATRTALMTAIAEEAMSRMLAATRSSLAAVGEADPLVRLSAIARGYLQFVVRNPMHFRIMSDRRLLDWSEPLQMGTAALQQEMAEQLRAAGAAGLLRAGPIKDHLLDARAVSYGVVRTYVDGQMSSWNVAPEKAEGEMAAVLHRAIHNMAQNPDRHQLVV